MMAEDGKPAAGKEAGTRPGRAADLSVWMIWGAIMLVAVAVLPFAVRSQDVVRAIATMCGFDIG
ncbi:MAG: hypothetical protein VXX69_04525 [Pseudomonadota bacterium]|nr:hypothetical protein [Pseudomonadota bacterium]MEC8712250.1 hypothetical protein [Pseudomonadota bacterium]